MAKEFCRPGPSGGWTFEPRMEAHIDFGEEFGSPRSSEFRLTRVLGVGDGEYLDHALLAVSGRSRQREALPPPLPLAPASLRVRSGRPVYVVGYPAPHYRRANDPQAVQKIFSGCSASSRCSRARSAATRQRRAPVQRRGTCRRPLRTR